MNTSSTRAGSGIVILSGLVLAFGGFALLLEAIRPDLDWRDADIGSFVFLIVVGLLMFLSGVMYPLLFGNSEEDLARPAEGNDGYSTASSDFDAGGD